LGNRRRTFVLRRFFRSFFFALAGIYVLQWSRAGRIRDDE